MSLLALVGSYQAGKAATVAPISANEPPALKTFYRQVLPDTGHYCLFIVGSKRHLWADSIDELVRLTEARSDATDVYYGTAAFKGPDNRTQANVDKKKCFYLDLDAGAAKLAKHGPDKVYTTQRDALAGLVWFYKATGLTPSLIVSSGEGLHVYWELDAPVDGATWTRVAKAFQKFCIANGLKVDSAVTADNARVLRPIGTTHPNGKSVAVLKDTGRVWRLNEFAKAVGVSATQNVLALHEDEWADGAHFEGGADLSVNDDLHLADSPPKSMARVLTECGAACYANANQENIEEPYWRLMIGLAKHTTEGREAAHAVSCRHPDYDSDETDAKFDRWEAGPSTCERFAEYSTACAQCKHKGMIKSPIQLGAEPRTDGLVHLPNGTARPTRTQLTKTLPDWKVTQDGTRVRPHNTTENTAALANMLNIGVRYNIMSRKTEILIPGLKSERDDYDTAALARFGDVAVRAGMMRDGLKELVDAVAGTSPYHPVLHWIEATPWDGTSRLPQFHESLELADNRQARLRDILMDAWALQGIAALLDPDGVATQGILVLNGAQDVFKTRWVENLCLLPGATRTGLHLDPLDKDSVFQATSAWIVELGEIDSTFRKADVSAMKAFITRREDVLRRPYAKTDNTYRRRTIFAGTVNGTGYLADDTGNRRFWVIAVRRCHLLAANVMQQVWAEYLAKYQAGERWHLSAETKAALNLSNTDHSVVDPLRERIQTSFDWVRVEGDNWHEKTQVLWLTATDVCIRIGIAHPSKTDSTRAGAIVSALNNRVSRKSNGAKLLALPSSAGARQ